MIWAYPLRLLPWEMRRRELKSVEPYLVGRGADVGCGRSKVRSMAVGIDLFPYPGVEVIADAHALPLLDSSLDYVASIHSLEHCKEPKRVLREWLRVLVDGGRVCLVLPDVRYTGRTNTDRTAHWHHWTREGFLCWLEEVGLGPAVQATGEACPRWSFYVILGTAD